MELSLIFKTLGDEVRLRIFGLLANRELCVCDIESVLEISQVNASRHLKSMKTAGILTSRKTAQWVYYDLNKKFLELYPELADSLKLELSKNAAYKKDIRALAALAKTKTEKC